MTILSRSSTQPASGSLIVLDSQEEDQSQSNLDLSTIVLGGQSIDRCFKIHGYPANFKSFKDKKVVALSSSKDVDMETDEPTYITYFVYGAV